MSFYYSFFAFINCSIKGRRQEKAMRGQKDKQKIRRKEKDEEHLTSITSHLLENVMDEFDE